MKKPFQIASQFVSAAIGVFSFFLAFNTGAIVIYYDPTGTTGNAQTSGIWENKIWSTSSAGTASASLTNFVEGDAPVFAAAVGADDLTYIVTANANHTVGGVFNGLSASEAGNVTITGPGILNIPVNPGSSAGFYTYGSVNNTTILSTIAGPGILTPQGGGSLFLYGSNTYTGGTYLQTSAGVNFNSSNSFGTGTILWDNSEVVLANPTSDGFGNTGATGPITIPNAVKTTNGTMIFVNAAGFPVTFSGAWTMQTGTSTVQVQPTGTQMNISGAISGSAVLLKAGAGTLQLSGANAYTGNTMITNGTLQLGASGGIPSGSGKGNVTVTNAGGATATLDVNGVSGSVNGLTGNGTIDNTSSTSGTLSVGNNNVSSTFTGTIQNSGTGVLNLAKAGTGTFTLNTTQTGYGGDTTVSAGTFAVGQSGAIPSGSPVVVSTGAILNMQGNSDTFAALSGGGSVTNNSSSITLDGSTFLTDAAGYSCFFGTIDEGQLIKNGAGVMSLRQTNMYNTNLIFNYNGGVLSVGAGPNRLPPAYALSVPSSGLFQLDANSQAVSSLNGSGAINLGGGTLTVNATSGSYYSGTIENSELITNSTAAGHGLRGYYYSNIDMSGLATVRDDATVNFTNLTLPVNLPSPPYPKTNYISIRWLGQVQTTAAGTYTFTITSDDGQRLWVNGTNLVDDWVSESATAKSGTITLGANTRYDIVMEYMNVAGGASTKLAWTPPGDSVSTVIPTDYLYLPPAGNLVISGTSQVTLAGSNTYTGGTVVANGGTLDASGDYTLGQGSVYVTNNGSLTMDSGMVNSYIGSNGDLIISPSALLNLDYTGTNVIHGFSTNGGASYLPPGSYGASGSGATYTVAQAINTGILNVTAVPSTNTLTSSGSPSYYGSSVTFTSTVTGSSTNESAPTGTVTFYDGASAIGMATLVGGQVVFTVSDLQAITSPHSITAVYNGDAVYIQSTSSALTQTVEPLAITATNLSVSNKLYDTTVNATFISGSLAGVLTNDSNYVSLSSATAMFATKTSGTNKTVIVTNFVLGGNLAGDYTVSPSSATTTANITNATLTVTNISAVNQVYTGSTNVSLNTGTAALVGVLGSDNVTLNTGSAAGSVATAGVGTNKAVTITGLALGGTDSGNYTLVEPSTTVTISQASTTNLVGSTADPSAPGASVTFSSTPTPVAPGAGTPTGSVVFLTNGVAFSTNTLASGTTSSLSTTNLPVGTNTITAQYAGDPNFIGSTNTLSQIVGSTPAPGALSISRVGGNVVLNWSGSFTLQSAPVVNGTNSGFEDVSGPVLTGPYTNTNSATEQYFRLRN